MIPFSHKTILEYEKRGWWGEKTLLDYMDNNAANYPDKVAYVDSWQEITWLKTKRLVDRLATYLLELGINKDDFVILQLPNSIEFILAHYALARAGAVSVPVVLPFRKHELDYILQLSGAVAAIIPYEYNKYNYFNMYTKLQEKHPKLNSLIICGEQKAPAGITNLTHLINHPPADNQQLAWELYGRIDPNDVVTMTLTSGTESLVKGVPRTHNNWICTARVISHDAWGRNKDDDILVTPLPLPNLFGLGCGLYGSLIKGQTMVLLEKFDPMECIKTIEKYRATHFMGVPAMHIAMLNCPEINQANLGSLKRVVTGGSPAPSMMIETYTQKFGVSVVNGWGANEGTFCGTRWDQKEHLADSIGPHPPSYDIKIVDENNQPLPPGQVGEIAMRGPCIFPGYHGRPNLNERSFDADGYFHSGDLGLLGFDGFYRFCGRKKDLIIRGGQNISAEEVEFLIQEHPKVFFVAAVGMPDERLGERVCVYVQLKDSQDNLTLEEIIDFLQEKDVAKYKLPERLELIDELPRTPTGKVQKFKLKEDIVKKLSAGA